MAWVPNKVNDLPHIIAGPIVRKVTANEVTVWVAVKAATSIVLKVYAPGIGYALMTSPSTTPIKVGDNLYITCVTAKDTTALPSSGVAFGYDLEFGSSATHLNSINILSKGLNGIEKITFLDSTETYKADHVRLPSFLLPPAEINNLNIYHGSCRKPHGGGVDAMMVLHDTLQASQKASTTIRPQMLFLTGDQIYADDVAGLLLHQIIKYHENDADGNSLIGWKEALPEFVVDGVSSNSKMGAGSRHEIFNVKMLNVPDHEKKTSGNHLLRMTEYMLMYCMVWSPELWDSDVIFGPDIFPNFKETYPEPSFKEYTAYQYVEKFFEGPNIKELDKNSVESNTFKDEQSKVHLFRLSLDKVRKALANIATYMVMDDHDVTDDWFFNEKWCKNVLDNPNPAKKAFGRRWMQNGMAAIAICQSWGNNPEQFESLASGNLIANAINSIGTYKILPTDDWGKIEYQVLPTIDTSATPHKLAHESGTFNWHWYLGFANYEFIALDGRTMRSFRNGEDKPSGMLSDEAINLQVRDIGVKGKQLTILLAGAPIFGVPSNEEGIVLVNNFWRLTKVTRLAADMESWNLDEHCRQLLLATISLRRPTDSSQHKVVILSGDVHYAFTNLMSYQANTAYLVTGGDNVQMKIAQCCASALKNMTTIAEEGEQKSTMSQHDRDIDKKFVIYTKPDNNIQLYCWDRDKQSIYEVDLSGGTHSLKMVMPDRHPSIMKGSTIRTFYGVSLIKPDLLATNETIPLQDWYESINFAVKTPEFEGIGTTISGTAISNSISRAVAHGYLANELNISGGAWLVGMPCIGNIVFDWTGSTKKLTQKIIWINNLGKHNISLGQEIIYVITSHEINL